MSYDEIMKPCPVCGRSTTGTAQNEQTHAFVIHTDGITHVVHNTCLVSFIERLQASASTWVLESIG